MWAMKMTLADYHKFLQDMMGLQMWYALHVAKRESISVQRAICAYTELYFYSDVYETNTEAPENDRYVKYLNKIDDKRRRMGDEAFLSSVWEEIGPSVLPRAAECLKEAQRVIERSYRGFYYEFHPVYFSKRVEPVITLHFRNYFAPDSPFKHMDELAAGLMKLLEHANSVKPEVQRVQCASWLNHLPAFGGLFPGQWRDGGRSCPREGHTGWWGQFIDRTGQVNPALAQRMRSTGWFTYSNLHCTCEVKHLRVHLTQLLADYLQTHEGSGSAAKHDKKLRISDG